MATVIGFSTQVVAHNLALGGDTMVMLQAVLDTNFWLATHVVTVTATVRLVVVVVVVAVAVVAVAVVVVGPPPSALAGM